MYNASCTSTGSGTPGTGSTPDGNVAAIAVTGLTNGQPYTCTVTAHNGIGDSAASSASDPATPASVPSAPAAPTIVRGNAQIAVTFNTPADNGSTITGYTATCASSDGGNTNSNAILSAKAERGRSASVNDRKIVGTPSPK